MGTVEFELKALSGLTELFLENNNIEHAMQSAQEMLILSQRTESYMNSITAHLLLAKCEQKSGNLNQALELAKKSKSMAYIDGPPNYKLLVDQADALINNLVGLQVN